MMLNPEYAQNSLVEAESHIVAAELWASIQLRRIAIKQYNGFAIDKELLFLERVEHSLKIFLRRRKAAFDALYHPELTKDEKLARSQILMKSIT